MDGLADGIALFQGQLARWGGSGGAVRGRSPLWPAASRRGRPDGGAVGRQGRLCDEGGVRCVGWKRERTRTGAGRRQWDAAARVHARAKRALWPRPEHAHQVFDEKPARSRELG